MPEADLPEELKPWAKWVLWPHQDRACPFLYNNGKRRCVWPGQLTLDLRDTQGQFRFAVSVYRRSLVELPGNSQLWPRDVMVNDRDAVVVDHSGTPVLQLEPGEHDIMGAFSWRDLPDALPVPPEIGLVKLTLNNQAVLLPELRQGRLWLRQRPDASDRQARKDSLQLRVYRKLIDAQPFQIVTLLDLEVSGRQRELLLGRPLLTGFIPLRVDSPLPARLEPDGQMRVQVKPGRWQISVTARHPRLVDSLDLAERPAPWPSVETWVFEARHHLRLVEITGALQIDPRQVALPSEWQSLPAYQITPGTRFAIVTRRRGDAKPEPDNLSLNRQLWLDFDGVGYTVRDVIEGTITDDWRLSVDPELDLGRATLDGKAQFITRLSDNDRQGVEVRRGQLQLVAESRLALAQGTLPASGWGREFQQVSTTLHVPPGWRLLSVSGVDNVPQSWLQRWTLYDLFLVLIAAVAVARLWNWPWAVFTLIALAVTWYEPQAPRVIWLYLIAGAALARVLPSGKGLGYLRLARYAGLAMLVLILVPFSVYQARTGLYPQLEREWVMPSRFPQTSLSEVQHELAPPSAVVADKAAEFIGAARQGAEEAVSSKVAPSPTYRATLDQADPDAVVQTGPGLPSWDWQQINLNWNGPVAAEQRIGLVMLGPLLNRVLHFVMIVLVVVLGWRLADLRSLTGTPRSGAFAKLVVAALLLPVLWSVPKPGLAAFPSQEMLGELERRLTVADDCLPRCADIEAMLLDVHPARYDAHLRVHALRETALPLPVDTSHFAPLSVSLDKEVAHDKLFRTKAGQLWVLLPAGRSDVHLQIALPNSNEVLLPLPLRPHRVEVNASGWTVAGVSEQGVPDSQLQLTRVSDEGQTSTEAAGTFAPLRLPVFARIEHTLRLGLQWNLETRVIRVSPVGTSLLLHVPLLPDESVITDGVRVEDGRVRVNMAPNRREVKWLSRLEPRHSLTLIASQSSQWVEVWKADIGSIWHVDFEGLAPVHHQGKGKQWFPTWQPWPGEQVTLSVSRPEGVPGRTLTIDQSRLMVKPGKRATDSELAFRVRASQGGQHDLHLPPGVELQSGRINGVSLPLRAENGTLSLPIVPGDQEVVLSWRLMQGVDTLWRTPKFALGESSVNANLNAQMAPDRWLLWVSGPRLGPAVLFWGILLVVILAAIILGRTTSHLYPLGTLSWLLLGVGLTQVSVFSGVLVIGWFALVHYRGTLPEEVSKLRFNLMQMGIAVVTLAVLAILFWAVQQGLLGRPQMQVSGFGSDSYNLNWYQDRVEDGYPQGSVVSVPLYVYRILMLLWALWLAFALLRWLQWGWKAFAHHGLWRSVDFQRPNIGRRRKQAESVETES